MGLTKELMRGSETAEFFVYQKTKIHVYRIEDMGKLYQGKFKTSNNILKYSIVIKRNN